MEIIATILVVGFLCLLCYGAIMLQFKKDRKDDREN